MYELIDPNTHKVVGTCNALEAFSAQHILGYDVKKKESQPATAALVSEKR